MAWKQGDVIYASTLASTNDAFKIEKSYGHQGWSWRYLDFYFWNERHTDETMMWYGSSRSAGCEHQLEMYRWENGQWQHKQTWHGSSTQLDGGYSSRGRGAYHIHFWDHNNTPTFRFYPATKHIERGNFLAMIDRKGPFGLTEGEAKSFNNHFHDVITADDLNSGRVYTYPAPSDPNDSYGNNL